MEENVGKVTHYYSRLGVAVLKLTGELSLGDNILIVGRITDLAQRVVSMEIDHQKVNAVEAGREVAIKVIDPVRRGDVVFKIKEEQPDSVLL